ncbi:dienelactone hydrolase family protein [Echinimonas agarilytica]|uniref:Dienelactone hydrolase family protein n=1 Tax=Echinimonas agarilytica TaxID=1215918 RepID=A0AA41W676_9GAMM|nr:dienelactone hydrolase family protein [Echinimonas agarilytica]MCM2679319.1 dienelactone hydrolase family protein [Echinimonas agarilytica]
MFRTLLTALCVAALIPFAASATIAKQQSPFTYYVNLPVQTLEGTLNVSAQYRLPREREDGPIPAVVILHSTGGVDSTGSYYAAALNQAGYATLELDMWSPRGFAGGSDSRPALPQQTIPDAFAALKYLAELEEIDATRIGVMGFSWGGVVTLLSATEQYNALMNQTGYRFAAHVAHYPICYLYNNDLVPVPGFDLVNITAPVLIQSGGRDDYDLPISCPLLVNGLAPADKDLVDLKMYPFAYHGWDRLEPTWVVEDPFANLGQGGEVTLKPSPWTAYFSRAKVVRHFDKAFAD